MIIYNMFTTKRTLFFYRYFCLWFGSWCMIQYNQIGIQTKSVRPSQHHGVIVLVSFRIFHPARDLLVM